MIQEELNRFLASVRRTRFVDYLDPMGETAHEALDRRLKWAERSRHDPAHAEEAAFLLRHENTLRELVSQELLDSEEDWVEAEEVGAGWSGQNAWTSTAPAPERKAPEPEPEPDFDDDDEPDMERTGIMRLEDLTEPPVPPRLDVPIIGGKPTYSATPPPHDLPDELVREIWNRNAPEGAPRYQSTPSSGLVEHEVEEPAVDHRSSPPPPPMPAPRAPVSASPTGEPRTEDRSALNIRASRQGAPAPRMPKQGQRRLWVPVAGILVVVLCGVLVAWNSGALDLPGVPPKHAGGAVAVEPPSQARVDPEPEEITEQDALADAEPEGEDTEDQPVEDPTDEPVAAAPSPPEPKPAQVAAVTPSPAPPAPARTEPARPAPAPAAPAPVVPAPAPATAAPVPPAPAPPPAVASKTTAEPAPQEPPKPEAPPKPEPEAVAAASEEPKASTSNTVQVRIPDAVTYPQLTGMWVGLAASRSFQLKVDSQSGGAFSGTAEVMDESGAWQTIQILGSVKEDGALKFTQVGGGASFSGTLDGIRASGTVKLTPDGAAQKWSVIK